MAIGNPTDARNSCWDAVLNWPALKVGGESIFRRKYRFDDDESPEVNPTVEQLPALALFPTPGDSVAQDVLNRVHQFDYRLTFILFTSTWNLETHDTYWQSVMRALFQSADSATPGVPYVKAATGFDPREAFQIATDKIMLTSTAGAKTKALLSTISFTLRVRFDPRS